MKIKQQYREEFIGGNLGQIFDPLKQTKLDLFCRQLMQISCLFFMFGMEEIVGSFQKFRDIGQNLFFCYKSFISCGKSESKKFIS